MYIALNQRDMVVKLIAFVFIPLMGFISPVLCVALTFVFAGYYMLRNDIRTLYFFICFSLIQNIMMLVYANRFDKATTTLMLLSKEIMIYGCVVISLVKNFKVSKDSIFSILFVLILGASFLISSGDSYAKILSIRQLLLPIICFYFGKSLKVNKQESRKVFRFIIYMAILTALIGILELLFFKDGIWLMLPLEKFNANKGTTFRLYNGVPTNYYTWDYINLIGKVVRRLVSIFGDPLVTGHNLFLGFILADSILPKGTQKKAIKSVLFICSLLTLSKGVYLNMILYAMFKLLRRMDYRSMLQFICAAIIALVFGGAIFYRFAVAFEPTSSAVIHFNGLIKGFSNGSLFGEGIGKAGVITNKLAQLENSLTGESYVGVVVSQLGYLGFALFLLFVGSNFIKLFKIFSREKENLALGAAILLVCVLAESFFSESSISITGTGLYFIIAGITQNIYGHSDWKLELQTPYSNLELMKEDQVSREGAA